MPDAPETTPNPGSERATKQGCVCPVIDNHYGIGEMGSFWINADCPLHGYVPIGVKGLTHNNQTTVGVAKAYWDFDRARLAGSGWVMPPWSRAPAWQRRPYLKDAQALVHEHARLCGEVAHD